MDRIIPRPIRPSDGKFPTRPNLPQKHTMPTRMVRNMATKNVPSVRVSSHLCRPHGGDRFLLPEDPRARPSEPP